jgi:anti-sigma factor RsiW
MSHSLRQSDLEAYLDEALSPDEMGKVEHALREEPNLLKQLAAICRRRDAGLHSLGEIWRRHRLSCPSREELGGYLLGAMSEEQCEFIRQHLEVSRCRFCAANVADMQQRQAEADETTVARRRKYFQSSAGYLQREE